MSQDHSVSNPAAQGRSGAKKKRVYSEANGEPGYVALADGTVFAG